MVRFFKWFLAIALVAAAMFGAYVYWMFYDNRMPAAGNFPLDMAAIRAKADTLAGDKAMRIEVETTSHTPTPKIAMVAGTSWGEIDMVRNSYRVVFPETSLIIDTAHKRSEAMQYGANAYDDQAWDRIIAAIQSADMIVITHGHPDHAGGLMANAYVDRVVQSALVSEEQIASMRYQGEAAEAFSPTITTTELQAIAPGVVLIPAPGHSPGSQMIYVQQTDGREFLFMGDTASLADNVRTGRVRSRYVMTQIGNDDRQAVMLQTAALQKLMADFPEIVLIPGHDGAETDALVARGSLVRGFSSPAGQ